MPASSSRVAVVMLYFSAQVTLAMIESALLTFVLLFPSIMDPIVQFINDNVSFSVALLRLT